MALLAACFRQTGHSVVLIDNEIENLPVAELSLKIALKRPRTVILSVCGHNPSASTQSMAGAVELVEALALFGIPTVLHGLHPSALPQETMIQTGVSGIIVGEGFDVIKKDEALEGIMNTQELADLDTLPFPAWDLLPIKKYRAHNWHCFGNINSRTPYGIVYSSLGCPNNCSFCVIHTMFKNSRMVRFRHPKLFADDVFWWIKQGVTNIRIVDENFTLHKKHVSDICSALKAKARDEQFDLDKLNMWAYASVSTVDKPMLANMSSVGIKWLCYGFETGNDLIARDCGKTKSAGDWCDRVIDVATVTYDAGIHILANWMFGFPQEDYFQMQQTLHLAQFINAEWANFYCAMAYPGSRLYDEAKAKGVLLPKKWTEFSQYSSDSLPLPTDHRSGKEVQFFRDYAFNMYFTNPYYLDMIYNKFGEETTTHIIEMTQTKLERS